MLTYKMGEYNTVSAKELIKDKGCEMTLYDAEFKEFVVYRVQMAGKTEARKIALSEFSVMLVIKGNAEVVRSGHDLIKAKEFSVWILEPGEYMIVPETDIELFIATEGKH